LEAEKEAREEIAKREKRKSQTEKKIHERKKKSARSALCDIHNNNTRTHLRAHRNTSENPTRGDPQKIAQSAALVVVLGGSRNTERELTT
jgi:hypothetical protein